jgi:hypothetical protein
MVQHSPTTARTLCRYFCGFCLHVQLLMSWRGTTKENALQKLQLQRCQYPQSPFAKSTHNRIPSNNCCILTINATSVSGFNPFFNTATPIDPMKPSKFSKKNPGCRILNTRLRQSLLLYSKHILTSNSVLFCQDQYSGFQYSFLLCAKVPRCPRT